MTNPPDSSDHLRGLDTIRFVAALWVAFAHGASLPLKSLLAGKGAVAAAVAAAHGVLFNGVAAVMAFFVISGFCIHHAWLRNPYLGVERYLIRRYLRILPPLFTVYAIMYFSDERISSAASVVLWSIYCEIIYYAIYPGLRYLIRYMGLTRLISLSMLISVLLAASRISLLYLWQFGIGFTWLLCLPAWLFGCLIAERHTDGTLIDAVGPLWAWRALGLAYSSLSLIVVYHGPLRIGLPVTMLIFSVYLYFWLQKEIVYLKEKTPGSLEWAGTWSYSLYLIHNMVIAKFDSLDFPADSLLLCVARLAAILLLSYLFFLVIESPSHRIARWAGRSSSRRNSTPVAAGSAGDG
jgi:peptidoglycan/LPS O-acetylase OafA/YrhL